MNAADRVIIAAYRVMNAADRVISAAVRVMNAAVRVMNAADSKYFTIEVVKINCFVYQLFVVN